MLYNKYRPKKINDLYGNEEVKNFLRALSLWSAPHAILLTGDSGCGKTTVARLIMMKLFYPTTDNSEIEDIELNMETIPNFIEMDAASNSGVDGIRALSSRIHSKTFNNKPRIIYIDECHALSSQAWDAALKMIEEENNTIFLFSSNEAAKIKKTIKTRTMELHLETPSKEHLEKFIETIFLKEGFTIDTKDKSLILGAMAFTSNSNYRTACNVIERVLLQPDTSKIITLEAIKSVISEEEITSLKTYGTFYRNGDWIQILNMIKTLPNDAVYSLAYYMYNSAKYYINQKEFKLKHIIFAKELAFLLASKTTLTKTHLEYVIFSFMERNL